MNTCFAQQVATATSATHSRLAAKCVKHLVCPYYIFMHAVLSDVTAQAAAANWEAKLVGV